MTHQQENDAPQVAHRGSEPTKNPHGNDADTTHDDPIVTDTSDEAAVIADEIALESDEGVVFGPLTFRIPSRGLTMLIGRGGSGRTALALCLAGRMRIGSGDLTVLGETSARRIRPHVAIAGIEEIDSLDRDVRVKTVITEHLAWSRPWFSWTPQVSHEKYEELCGKTFGDRDLPPLDVYVSKLSALDRILLRIALALNPADGERIDMLMMDDLDQVREYGERLILVKILHRISQDIPVVVNAVNDLPAEFMPEHKQIEIDSQGYHLQPESVSSDVEQIRQFVKELSS